MLTFNTNTEFRTKVDKPSIRKNSYVRVSNPGDYQTYCECEDEFGNKESYKDSELQGFGLATSSNTVFDNVEDIEDDTNGHVLYGLLHISPDVRSGRTYFRFWEDCLYTSVLLHPTQKSYNYKYREISDDEAIQILIDEIIYGMQPRLQSTTLAGYLKPGIDSDDNLRTGTYVLCNNKEYKIARTGKTFTIKIDGKNSITKDIDWERMRKAYMRADAAKFLKMGDKLFFEHPEIADILIKDLDKENYKLYAEFNKKD